MVSTLITVAPTGAEAEKVNAPALPVTLEELVQTAKECESAGAAVIHVHIRDDEARPTLDPVRLRETVAALRQSTNLIVQLSTGGAPYGGHVHCDLVMGVPGGMPGDARSLVAAVEALPEGVTWSATGIGRTTLPVMYAALAAGGHLRVGMEDTLTYAKGRPVTANAQLVERAATLAKIAQREPMSPDDARSFLGIKRR
jgi:uncharacterized protein (DUF849 family)